MVFVFKLVDAWFAYKMWKLEHAYEENNLIEQQKLIYFDDLWRLEVHFSCKPKSFENILTNNLAIL